MVAQAQVDPAEFADYDWSGRSIKNHRVQVRAALYELENLEGTVPAWSLACPFTGPVELGYPRLRYGCLSLFSSPLQAR